MNAAWMVEWIEYEKGWGFRPDGVSYYSTKELAVKKATEHIRKLPPDMPAFYSEPGKPKQIEVTEEQMRKITEAEAQGRTYWEH